MTERKIEVYTREGRVIWADTVAGTYDFAPGEAVSMANVLLHCAEDCGADIKFEVDKPELCSNIKRAALIIRTAHIMRSMTQVKDRQKVAAQIVDSILGALS